MDVDCEMDSSSGQIVHKLQLEFVDTDVFCHAYKLLLDNWILRIIDAMDPGHCPHNRADWKKSGFCCKVLFGCGVKSQNENKLEVFWFLRRLSFCLLQVFRILMKYISSTGNKCLKRCHVLDKNLGHLNI